jgi:hypothetical protein
LLVRFDPAGTVTATDMQEKECPAWHAPDGYSLYFPPECLEMSGADAASGASAMPHITTSIDIARQLVPADEKVEEVFEGMRWFPGLAVLSWRDFLHSSYLLDGPGLDGVRVIVSDQSLTFSRAGGEDHFRRIPFARISAVEVTNFGKVVVVRQGDGQVDSFMQVVHDDKRFQAAIALVRSKIQAVNH